MALSKEVKAQIVAKYGVNEHDTGSTKVQIALLTARIKYLTEHFKSHAKDFHSRRGMLKIVGNRRRLLDYVKKRDIERYRTILKELNIRK